MSSSRRRPSLATTIVIWVLALMTVAMAIVGAATLTLTRGDLQRRLDLELREALQRNVMVLAERDDHRQDAPQAVYALTYVVRGGVVDEARSGIRQPDATLLPLSAADVAVLADAGLLRETEFSPAGGRGQGPQMAQVRPVTLRIAGEEYRVASQTSGGRGERTLVVTGLPTSAAQETTRRLLLTFVLVAAGTLLATALVLTWLIRRTLRPLGQVSRVASEVAALPLASSSVVEQRVPADVAFPGTEVGDVGHALNLLLDNVSEAFAVRERGERTLREFVADASHELRTPLAAIRGYTDMVELTEELSPDGAQALARVDSQTQRMTGLVEDLLTLARLDAANPVPLGSVDLTERVVEAVGDARTAAPDHDWRVMLQDDPVMVVGNAGQLEQVLANLLSNASRHTPAGTTVTVGLTPGEGSARLTVADDGPGIPEAFQARLFDRFARADGARVATSGSTGLGLAITKAIIERSGGTITLESHPGHTCFTVVLPLARG